MMIKVQIPNPKIKELLTIWTKRFLRCHTTEQTFVYNSILLTGLEINCTVRHFLCPWCWLLIDFNVNRDCTRKFVLSVCGCLRRPSFYDLFSQGRGEGMDPSPPGSTIDCVNTWCTWNEWKPGFHLDNFGAYSLRLPPPPVCSSSFSFNLLHR